LRGDYYIINSAFCIQLWRKICWNSTCLVLPLLRIGEENAFFHTSVPFSKYLAKDCVVFFRLARRKLAVIPQLFQEISTKSGGKRLRKNCKVFA